MKVSIIIPVYNLEHCIAKTIESCLGQSYRNLEVVIVNDGSTDGSEQAIMQYLSDERVVYVKQQNAGVSAARNQGVQVATGDYLTFVDGDDLLASDTIKKNVELIEASKEPVEWLAFPVIRIDENGSPLTTARHLLQDHRYTKVEELDARHAYARYEKGWFPPVVCSMLFKSSFFDRQFISGRYEDTYMFLELLEKRPHVLLSPYGAYCYVNRENSFINEPFSAEKWTAYTRARIKSVQVGMALFPERKSEFRKMISSMYYNLKWLKFKNRHDANFSKPLCLLLSSFSNIKKGGCTAWKYYTKCAVSLLLPKSLMNRQ